MSLKAGRVGVNPADVDPIDGHISPSSIEGYTKEEADAKFETQEAASALQPKTLAVPIKYLNGSVVGLFNTVQDALSGSYGENGAKTNQQLTEELTVKDGTLTSDYTISTASTFLKKYGKVVTMNAIIENITNVTAWSTVVATIPEGFRPSGADIQPLVLLGSTVTRAYIQKSSGKIQLIDSVGATATTLRLFATWITD